MFIAYIYEIKALQLEIEKWMLVCWINVRLLSKKENWISAIFTYIVQIYR